MELLSENNWHKLNCNLALLKTTSITESCRKISDQYCDVVTAVEPSHAKSTWETQDRTHIGDSSNLRWFRGQRNYVMRVWTNLNFLRPVQYEYQIWGYRGFHLKKDGHGTVLIMGILVLERLHQPIKSLFNCSETETPSIIDPLWGESQESFTNMAQLKSQHGKAILCRVKCGMKILIYFQTANACTVEIWELVSNFIPHFIILLSEMGPMWPMINSLWPSDAIWRQRSGSTLTQVMAYCLTAPSHYLNQCWLIISKVQWYLSVGTFTTDTSAMNHLN